MSRFLKIMLREFCILLLFGFCSSSIYASSPLHEAAENGAYELVETLLKSHCIDVNAQNEAGNTALHYAADNNHIMVVEVLLRSGADPNKTNLGHAIPLHWAAQNGHVAVVERLLAAGADPNIQNMNKSTALILAAKNGHVDVVRLLCKAGSHPDCVDQCGNSALHLATGAGQEMVAILLTSGADPKKINIYGDTTLICAVKNWSADVVQQLLAAGVDTNRANLQGETALLLAAKKRLALITENLLKAGADPNKADDLGNTPLHRAAIHGDWDTASKLFTANTITINVRNKDGYTPLQLAKDGGHTELIEIIETFNKYKQEESTAACSRGTSWGSIIASRIVSSISHLPKFLIGAAVLLPQCSLSKVIKLTLPYMYSVRIPLLYFGSNFVKKLCPENNHARLKDTDKQVQISLDQFIANNPELGPLTNISRELAINPHDITICLGCGTVAAGNNVVTLAPWLDRVFSSVDSKIGCIGHELCHIHDKFAQKSAVARGVLLPLLVDCAYLGFFYYNCSWSATQSVTDYLVSMWIPRELLRYFFSQIITMTLCRYYEKKADSVSARLGHSAKEFSNAFYKDHISLIKLPFEFAPRIRTFLREFFDEHPASRERARYLAEIAINEQGAKREDLMVYNAHLTRELIAKEDPMINFFKDRESKFISAQNLMTSLPLDVQLEPKEHSLMYAAINNDIFSIIKLIKDRADLNNQDTYGWTPLHWAASYAHKNAVETLITNGASLDLQNSQGSTPLHLAIAHAHLSVVRLLVQLGAHVNVQDGLKRTPLHWAAKWGYLRSMKEVLSGGARVNIRDFEEKTPLDLAIENHNKKETELLSKVGTRIKTTGQQLLALANAQHQRLGESSPARLLTQDLLIRIGEYAMQEAIV